MGIVKQAVFPMSCLSIIGLLNKELSLWESQVS